MAPRIGEGFLLDLAASACFGAYGFHVEDIAGRGADMRLKPDGEGELLRLLPALAGFSVVATVPKTFRVHRAGDTKPLVDVSSEALKRARDAPTHLRDLLLLELMFHATASRCASATQLLHDIVAVEAKVVAFTSMQQLATQPHSAQGFATIAERLGHARQFALDHGHLADPVVSEAVRRLERAKGASMAVRSGTLRLRRLTSALTNLFKWADAHGAEWPPI
jgi:hypothetical protein